MQTYDTVMSGACIGDTMYCTGEEIENPVDSEKKAKVAKWENHSDCGPQKKITSTGKIVGSALPEGQTDAVMLAQYLIDYYDDEAKTSLTQNLLDTLKAKGKKIYLLSNAQRSFTENELNMLDLTKYFDGICISSDEECSKPDEKYFKTLFDRYGLEKSESIMIGNDYISDIGGAADFGIDSLYIHQSISPEIDGELRSTYKVMDGDVFKIKKLIINHS